MTVKPVLAKKCRLMVEGKESAMPKPDEKSAEPAQATPALSYFSALYGRTTKRCVAGARICACLRCSSHSAGNKPFCSPHPLTPSPYRSPHPLTPSRYRSPHPPSPSPAKSAYSVLPKPHQTRNVEPRAMRWEVLALVLPVRSLLTCPQDGGAGRWGGGGYAFR